MTAEPIKVMRVIARMNVGGPAWQVSVLTRGLVPPDFDSTLVCGFVSEGEADFIALRDPELPCRQIEGLGRSVKPLDDLRAFFSLVRLMRAEKPDIVHTHTAKAGVLGRLAAIVARIPIRVHTFHGHVLHGYFSPRVTKVIVLIERLLARRTTALAAVGSQVRDDLVAAKIGRLARYHVVPPGVAIEASLSKTEARSRLGLPVDAPIALFVGRLTQIKRPDRLIEAFRTVLSSQPSTILAIAGEGDLLDETKAKAADLGDSVRFLGWQADLSAIYPIADVVVLTSDNEGMPVTLIEASMLGIPCVTTGVGSAREVVIDEQTGYVTSNEPADIATAVIRVLSTSKMAKELGSRAKEHAEQNFGATRLVDDYRSIYQRLASTRRKPPG